MGIYTFRISQPGFDVKTCTDEQLSVSEKFNMLKTLAIGLTTGSASIAHGRSYIPIFFTSVQSSGKSSIVGDDIDTTCDATNINLPATTKYYLFYQAGV